mgnify:CR=1 FL=1
MRPRLCCRSMVGSRVGDLKSLNPDERAELTLLKVR